MDDDDRGGEGKIRRSSPVRSQSSVVVRSKAAQKKSLIDGCGDFFSVFASSRLSFQQGPEEEVAAAEVGILSPFLGVGVGGGRSVDRS